MEYITSGPLTEPQVLRLASELISKRYQRGTALISPEASRELFQSRLAWQEREIFAVAYLDNQHRLIELAEPFMGSISTSPVYPREIAKQALSLNAAAVIFAHNHPSGVAEPSEADRKLTQQLQQTLELFEIRVLDHLVIGGDTVVSFAERLWL